MSMYSTLEPDRSHPHIPPLPMDQIPQPYPPPAVRPTMPAPMTVAPHPPQATSSTSNGRRYRLEVVQQPIRARMCGFGDKDRRPITPPPCVRLIVTDEVTGKEIDPSDIDTSFFVLTVDLWNAEGDREVNLVRHSATSPSISTASASSYPPPPQTMPQYSAYGHPSGLYGQPSPYQAYYGQHYNPQPALPYGGGQAYYMPQSYYPNAPPQLAPQPMMPQMAPAQQQGMFTRNLIGSLSASAFKLSDTENKIGIWFILQDLSVRTEGAFRLKMNFVDVAAPQVPGADDSSSSETPGPAALSHGACKILSTVFSEPLHVYSAKKFPGVIESTPLSKCFAIQGIKIPIRKDGVKGARGNPIPSAQVMKERNGDANGDEWED